MEEVIPILAIECLIDIITMMVHFSKHAYGAWYREPIILSVFAVFPESLYYHWITWNIIQSL